MLKGQWGENANSYQFKYHNPWVWDDRKSFTFRLWDTQGNIGLIPLIQDLDENYGKGLAPRLVFQSPTIFAHHIGWNGKTWKRLPRVRQGPINTIFAVIILVCHMTPVTWPLTLERGIPQHFNWKGLPVVDISLDFMKYDTIWNWFIPLTKNKPLQHALCWVKLMEKPNFWNLLRRRTKHRARLWPLSNILCEWRTAHYYELRIPIFNQWCLSVLGIFGLGMGQISWQPCHRQVGKGSRIKNHVTSVPYSIGFWIGLTLRISHSL